MSHNWLIFCSNFLCQIVLAIWYKIIIISDQNRKSGYFICKSNLTDKQNMVAKRLRIVPDKNNDQEGQQLQQNAMEIFEDHGGNTQRGCNDQYDDPELTCSKVILPLS